MTNNIWLVMGWKSRIPETIGIYGGGWERTLLLGTKFVLFFILLFYFAYHMPEPIRVSSGWVLVHDKSLHNNLRNSSCPYFRPPSSEASWRRERAPGGGEALPAVRSTHLPRSPWSVCQGVGGKQARSRQAPLGAKVSRNTPSPSPRRCGPWGVGSGDNFGGSPGPRLGGPRSGGGGAGRSGPRAPAAVLPAASRGRRRGRSGDRAPVPAAGSRLVLSRRRRRHT
jgi:hypothetical protein